MGIEHYNQPHAVFFILEVSNAFFTTVFGLGKYTHFVIQVKFKVFIIMRFKKKSSESMLMRLQTPSLHSLSVHFGIEK